MADTEISIASISAQKLTEISQKAEVSVFRKALDQQANISALLIQSASASLPEGKGERLNIVA